MPYREPGGSALDLDTAVDAPEDQPRELIGPAEHVLLGMGSALESRRQSGSPALPRRRP